MSLNYSTLEEYDVRNIFFENDLDPSFSLIEISDYK